MIVASVITWHGLDKDINEEGEKWVKSNATMPIDKVSLKKKIHFEQKRVQSIV